VGGWALIGLPQSSFNLSFVDWPHFASAAGGLLCLFPVVASRFAEPAALHATRFCPLLSGANISPPRFLAGVFQHFVAPRPRPTTPATFLDDSHHHPLPTTHAPRTTSLAASEQNTNPRQSIPTVPQQTITMSTSIPLA
jgi:hypothetical protein